MLRNQRGFTLIELIVIIVIIGILAAVAIPTYMNLTQSAADGSARGILGALRAANGLLFANNLLGNTPGSYPMPTIYSSANVQGVVLAGSGQLTALVTIGGYGYTFTIANQPWVPSTFGAITELNHPTW